MHLTAREFDKLLVYMMADVALKRKAKGLKLNYPEAVAVISAVALDGARAGKTIEDVTKDARTALTKADVMDGVADLIPMVQIEAVFTDGHRLVPVHTPIQGSVRKGDQHGRSKTRTLYCRRCRSRDG